MLDNLFSLSGRLALVTGGSTGIGKMIAQGFVEYGAKVYIVGRNAEACERVARELSAKGGVAVALPGDVSSSGGIAKLIEDFSKRETQLDILVNNAGIAKLGAFDDVSEEDWDEVFALNLKAPFFLTQGCKPLLTAGATPERPSKVINLASVDAFALNPNEMYSYAASKAGVVHLTRRMALRLAQDNVIVTGIAPGSFPSTANTKAQDPGYLKSGRIAVNRVGTLEDMAGTAIYLASRAGDYTLGVTVIVDGGLAFATHQPR